MDELASSDAPAVRVAGFWRRLAAFTLDSLLGGLLGVLVGLAMFDTLAQLGAWGRAVGFIIAVAYFGIFNSRIGGGQTLGKMAFGIEVIDRNGDPLSLPRSLARAAVLCAPLFLNGASFSSSVLLSYWVYPLTLLVFGGLGAIVYLYVFNRPTRQSLHDLAVGSYVVRNDEFDAPSFSPVRRVHLTVVAILVAASAGIPAASGQLAQMQVFRELLPAYEEISRLPHVGAASVQAHVTKSNAGPVHRAILVQMRLDVPQIDDKALATRAARIVLERIPTAKDRDAIRVGLVYGYDIGFASSNRIHNFIFDRPCRHVSAKRRVSIRLLARPGG